MRFSTLHRPAGWLGLTTVAVMVNLPPLLNITHADEGIRIEQVMPGSQLSLTIQRDGSEETVEVTLGDMHEAPLAFLREAFEPLLDDSFERDPPENRSRPTSTRSWTGIVESTIEELREQLRELQQEVRELRQQQATPQEDDEEEPNDKPDPRDARLDSSTKPAFILAQRGDRRDRWLDRNREWDARPYRYGNRYYNYGNTWPYYRSPLNRSPYYGNYYYRYNGIPYYYGGNGLNLGLGWRSGVQQLGRNLGYFWY